MTLSLSTIDSETLGCSAVHANFLKSSNHWPWNRYYPLQSLDMDQCKNLVVVGTVEQGTLKKGDTVEIKGFDNEVKTVASDIQVFKQSVKQVRTLRLSRFIPAL